MSETQVDTSLVEILLVEDNPDDEQLTIEALKQYRLANHLHVVRDGAEALDFLFSRGRYGHRRPGALRVVLLDIKLPKVDGLEVLREVRSHPETERLPVVLLTSSAEERDIHRGYELNANSYIVKPVDFKQFVESVKEIGLYWAVLNRMPVTDAPKSATLKSTPPSVVAG
jgi:two-component system, response regulator